MPFAHVLKDLLKLFSLEDGFVPFEEDDLKFLLAVVDHGSDVFIFSSEGSDL